MSTHDKTLKLVTNLDRAGIEQRLGQIRDAARSAALAELAQMFAGGRVHPVVFPLKAFLSQAKAHRLRAGGSGEIVERERHQQSPF